MGRAQRKHKISQVKSVKLWQITQSFIAKNSLRKCVLSTSQWGKQIQAVVNLLVALCMQEAVESCLTRITKLELQQQQQQVVQLEGVENANARALLGKLINVILALMAVLLVFVSTLANFITPLMKTRARVAATVLLTLLLFILWKQWDFVEPWLLPS